MNSLDFYTLIFALIVFLSYFFRNNFIPLPLILIFSGIIVSVLPIASTITLNPQIVLNILLPLLIYQISAFSSWRDIKKNIRSIALLSIGHVVFITVLVAVCMHTLLPLLGWPFAFIFGAIISPPDDVAIVSVAENIPLPDRIFTILKGEALFNDAAALTFFRFSMAALYTHEFSISHAFSTFIYIIFGETLFGFVIGHLLGKLRQKIKNSSLHLIASVLTPFIVYIPVVKMGGSGIIATALTGFIIGNEYSIRFTSEFRLFSRALWPTFAFAIESILFILVGLNFRIIFANVPFIQMQTLTFLVFIVIGTIIIGRFLWEYIFVGFLPRFLFSSIRKKDPYPSWQSLFIISWAGMRGSISLAAALSIPFLPIVIDGMNPKDLIVFLVCCTIIATLILQGLTLPLLIKLFNLHHSHSREKEYAARQELVARKKMAQRALQWLISCKSDVNIPPDMLVEIKIHIRQYKILLNHLKIISSSEGIIASNKNMPLKNELFILTQLAEIERMELLALWKHDKINLQTRNKLLAKLDHRNQQLNS